MSSHPPRTGWAAPNLDTSTLRFAQPSSSQSVLTPREAFAPPTLVSSSFSSSSLAYCPPPAVRMRHEFFPMQSPITWDNASHDSDKDDAPALAPAINPEELEDTKKSPKQAACYTCREAKKRCDKNLDGCSECERRGMFCFYPIKSWQGRRSDVYEKTVVPPDPAFENHRQYKEDTAAVLFQSRKAHPRAPRASKRTSKRTSKRGTRTRRSVR